MRASTLAWIWIAQGIGGATPAVTKLALEGMGPFGLVVARQLLGTLFLLALAAWGARARGGASLASTPWTRRDHALLLVLAWAGFALPQVLGALGLTLSSATHGALLSPLEPIGILLGAALVLRERLGIPHLLAGGLGALGTLLIVLPALADGADPRAGHLGGDLIMAAGHLSWAIYTLAAKSLVARHDPLHVAIRAGAVSWIPLAPLALAEGLDPARALPALGWVVLLAFLATAVGTVAWNRALREVTAGTMAIFVFVQPVVGLAIGVLALGEPVTAASLAGAALIAVGVALATLRGERVAARPAVEAS
jgi:drug/metabolite transporter (DMT)-like permease